MRRRLGSLLLACAAALTFACEDDVIVGEQCPSPYSGEATIEVGDASLDDVKLLGTSCAPCDGTGARLDDKGCPIYVTPQSCGGPVCVAGAMLSVADAAAPPVGDDDGGLDGEDGGND